MTTNLIKINTVALPKVKKYAVQYNKLWTDAGRNMQGDLRSTFVGIFPKIVLNFAHTTQAEVGIIIALINLASFTVEWWDADTETVKSGTFYAGDFEVGVFNKSKELYEPFTVNLIAFNKLT